MMFTTQIISRLSVRGRIIVLGVIPVIGFLFGHTTRNTDETELYLFLTPRIIRGDADVDTLTEPLQKRIGSPPNE